MSILTAFFIFILIWWVVIFTVLPWGNDPFARPETGHAASAPANPRLRKKLLITTIISLALTVILYVVVDITDWSFIRMMQKWAERS
jgi:predicted secreted protein